MSSYGDDGSAFAIDILNIILILASTGVAIYLFISFIDLRKKIDELKKDSTK